jgi:HSP20 family protein
MMTSAFGPAGDPFRELTRLQNMLDQVFRPAERSSIRGLAGSGFPAINVGTTPDSVEIMALAPGLAAESLQLTVDRGVLTIAGERQAAVASPGEDTTVYAQERFAGGFRRVVNLPDDADPAKVDATYRDGILRVSVAKRESSRPRRIEIG